MQETKALLYELCEAGRHPARTIAQSMQETGKKALGMFPLFLPEELFYAAGFLPVGLWGGMDDFQRADAYLQSFCCNIIRSNMELALQGKYDFLEAIAIPSQCDTLKCVCENMKVALPNTSILGVTIPHNRRLAGAQEQMRAELTYLTHALEQLPACRCPLDVDGAWAVYEDYRAVMKDFIALVPQHLNTITPKMRHAVIKAAYFMDKATYTEKMRRLVAGLQAQPAEVFTGVRLVATGIMLDAEPVLDLLEELHIAIVDELFCHESLQFRTESCQTGDSLSKIAQRILDLKGASPLYDPGKPRGNLLADMVEEHQADAVLFCLTKFCDPDAFDQPMVKKDLDARGIHVLNLELNQHVDSVEQLRTRIQGFLEMHALDEA